MGIRRAGGKRRARGEGSIFQRADGLWRGCVMVGYKPDGGLDKRWVAGKTQDAVRQKLDALRQQHQAGTLLDRSTAGVTVKAYLEHWLDASATTLRPRTIHRYGELVRLHIIPALGKRRLLTLRPDHVQQFYASKLAAGLAAQTVVHIHRALHERLTAVSCGAF
ncbi:MAG: hypothetical protein CL878_13685 [Dehalococcoidia bacterium]|nr:hypothetical protein [Dehalococcoidia bacterium]